MKLASPLSLWCQILDIYVFCIWKVVTRLKMWGIFLFRFLWCFGSLKFSCDKWNCSSGIHLVTTIYLLFGCLCDARMRLWPSQTLTDFAWEEVNYFSFLRESSPFLSTTGVYFHLSPFLTPVWVHFSNDSKGNLIFNSSPRTEPIVLSTTLL